MRIGLFSDTFRPTINGITYVVDTLKQELEAKGHEVYIFCPARTLRPSKIDANGLKTEDDHILRFPSFPSGFFDDFDFTLFYPPGVMRQIKEMNLDVIHIFTPSQVGLLGINSAIKNDIPLVIQHSTDLYEFSENYPQVLPGALALVGIVFPMSVKLTIKDFKEILKLYQPRSKVTLWNKDIISKAITILYSKADAVVALSRKSVKQLRSWQGKDYPYEITLLPSGVDAIAMPSQRDLEEFKKKWGIEPQDEVFGFVGRLGEEKNLDVLIKAFDKIIVERPNAKLLFVGDFEYRKVLEAKARKSKHPERIIFTGFINREDLGKVYASMKVFVFPSLKDTQGWVIHEAAHAGLPLVLLDQQLSEVMIDGENGYFANNSAADISRKVIKIFGSKESYNKFSQRSQELANNYTQSEQTQKIIDLYKSVIANYQTHQEITARTRLVKAVKKFILRIKNRKK